MVAQAARHSALSRQEKIATASFGRRLRWWSEWAGATVFVTALRMLPTAVSLWLARRLGDVLFVAMGARVRECSERVATRLGWEQDDPRARRTVRRCLQNFVQLPVELVLLHRGVDARGAQKVLGSSGDAAMAVIRSHPGALIATAHFGNPEVPGALAPLYDIPLVAVARGVKNPRIHRLMTSLRERFGMRVADKDGAWLRVWRELKRGSWGAMLLDQHAGQRGVRVPFFGEPASTFSHAARLAHRHGRPLLPIWCRRTERPLQFVMQVEDPIYPDPDLDEEEDAYRMILAYNRALEAAIRQHPEQWLWLHRRWKRGGVEPSPEWVARYAATS